MWLVLTIFILMVHTLQSTTGTTYYSTIKQVRTALDSPPIILSNGTVGSSTVYLNGTSANVNIVTQNQTDFNYVLKITENHGSSWKIRLKAYNQSNIGRLINCSIYIYNGSNSIQIVILNGAYSQQIGAWYDLFASDSEYVWVHVERSYAGTSYVYAYLEVSIPNTATYAQYLVTFVIT